MRAPNWLQVSRRKPGKVNANLTLVDTLQWEEKSDSKHKHCLPHRSHLRNKGHQGSECTSRVWKYSRLTRSVLSWKMPVSVHKVVIKPEMALGSVQFSSVHSFSCVRLFATPWTTVPQASLSITNSQSLLKLMFIEWVICHPTISSFVIPFFSCLQFLPASGSFKMSQFFTSGGQSIGVSASASVPPVNTQDCFPLGNPFHSYCFSHLLLI